MSEILYQEWFEEADPGIWYYSDCHKAPFKIEYQDKLLVLRCADCGELKTYLAIQEPLWEPEFPYEATFRCKLGKVHLLFFPNPTTSPQESEEWWDETQRQKYRLVFIMRSNQGEET